MNTPLFGANVDPGAGSLDAAFAIAELVDSSGLDLVTIQDHPYNKDHLDTWTLLATIAARTSRVHVGTNVANVPLRGPALLAKMAASLDVISGGRVELGLGAVRVRRGFPGIGAEQQRRHQDEDQARRGGECGQPHDAHPARGRRTARHEVQPSGPVLDTT